MRLGALIFIFLVVGLLFSLDLYVFEGIQTLTATLESGWLKQGVHWGHWAISAVLSIGLLVILANRKKMGKLFPVANGLFITMLVTKIVFVLVLLSGSFFQVAEEGIYMLAGNEEGNLALPDRSYFFSQFALVLAAIPFTTFLYGITKGKYKYKVHKHVLYFDHLPEAFDGFTITQISDIHSGSLDDKLAVQKGIEIIQQQNSDLFVFTGDLVNATAEEFKPWVDSFKNISAPYGQYSILGNHDYGDYHSWPSEVAKEENMRRLLQYHQSTGFQLLLDENVTIEKDGQKIYLLGVENWGIGFGKRGKLNKALENVPVDAFKVLLSHDPSHWDHEVKDHITPIDLTLSGHTHGMQLGFEFAKLRWSPAKYRYPNWAGIASDRGKYLNVNRGFGFHGFAGRVGIWPEITVLELRKSR